MLQRGEVSRGGGQAAVHVDVRLVTGTCRDLRHEIAAARFREDLFRRLGHVRVVLAPLRDRLEDIPLVCQKILAGLSGLRDAPVLIERARSSSSRRSRGPATCASSAPCSPARRRSPTT